VSDSAPDSAGIQDQAADFANSSSQAADSALKTVSDNAPDAEGAEASELASKAAESVSENVPESMGGKDKLENVDPNSAPGKFESFIDSLKSKLPGQPEPSTQSTASSEAPNSKEAGDLVKGVSDNISDSVGPITPEGTASPVGLGDATSAAAAPTEALSSVKESAEQVSNSVSDAVTTVSETVSSAADAVFSPSEVTQVSASVGDAGRDAVKDATNPANTGEICSYLVCLFLTLY